MSRAKEYDIKKKNIYIYSRRGDVGWEKEGKIYNPLTSVIKWKQKESNRTLDGCAENEMSPSAWIV